MPIYLGSQPIGEVNISFTSPDGGTNTNDATLQSGAQMLEGVTAYSKGKKITGTISTKTESNLTATENVVNVPAGYYASAYTKEVATAELPEPEATVDETGLVSIVSNLTSSGFLSSGQKTNTLQLPVQTTKTITPNSTEQVAVAAYKYTTGAVKVAAVPSETKKIIANGTYTPSNGKYFSSVEVAIVGDTPVYQDKTVNPTTSIQTVLPDEGYDALSQVRINAISVEQKSATPKATAQDIMPSSGSYLTKVTIDAVPTETKSVTENGTYVPTSGKWFSSVSVNVPMGGGTPTLQEKSVSPTESAQEVVADAGYDGLSKVSVGAISADYIGSGITKKSAETYIPTKSTQTISAGQYLSGAQTIAAIPRTYVETLDATAVASDLNSGKTAYVNGVKVTGTQVIQKYYTSESMVDNSFGNDGDIFMLTGGTT